MSQYNNLDAHRVRLHDGSITQRFALRLNHDVAKKMSAAQRNTLSHMEFAE